MDNWVNEVSFSKIHMISGGAHLGKYRSLVGFSCVACPVSDISETDIRQAVEYTNLELRR